MDGMKIHWIFILTWICYFLEIPLFVQAACAEPLGVANAYITSTTPYNTGDRVYFRCYSGFTMAGTPSLECLASGSFSGTFPTCTANDQAVTIRQTVNKPSGAENNGWMMLAFGSFIGLILLMLIILALVFFYVMFKRQAAIRRNFMATQQNQLGTSPSNTSLSNMHRDSYRRTSQVGTIPEDSEAARSQRFSFDFGPATPR